jgi:hypothetical protein
MILGWCAAQRGLPLDPKETEHWQAGYRQWPTPLPKPPTLSQEMSEIRKRPLN